MDSSEVRALILAGSEREACLDIRLMPEYPGLVRTVRIRGRFLLEVDFDAYNMREGGYYFRCEFDTLENAIKAVEDYLGKKICELEDCMNFYPEKPEISNYSTSWRKLVDDIESHKLDLPRNCDLELKGGKYLRWERYQSKSSL